jgi:hypothetical protein
MVMRVISLLTIGVSCSRWLRKKEDQHLFLHSTNSLDSLDGTAINPAESGLSSQSEVLYLKPINVKFRPEQQSHFQMGESDLSIHIVEEYLPKVSKASREVLEGLKHPHRQQIEEAIDTPSRNNVVEMG